MEAATAWCGLAQSAESFIMARALCGLGAGGSMALGTIITSDLVPIEHRGSYQSLINVMWGAGPAIGAAMGGVLAESFGWRWVFGIQVPPLLLVFAISIFTIPRDLGLRGKPPEAILQALRGFDIQGSVLLTVATTAFILGLNLGGNIFPWSHLIVIASLTTFTIVVLIFFWAESRSAKPIMPLYLIFKMPFASLIFSNFIAALLHNAILFNMPLYFEVFLTSATTSGLRLVIPSIVSSIVGKSLYTGRLKWPLIAGTAASILSNSALVFLRRNLPSPLYILILIPGSVASGFQFPGTLIALLASNPQSEQAVTTSTLLLWRGLGGVLGIATSSLIVQNALLYYLQQLVHEGLRDEVISDVRKSVEIIPRLQQPYREQVIQSYEAALQLTSCFTNIMAIISFFLILPIKLARLPRRR